MESTCAPVRTVLCLSSYQKGEETIRAAKALGCSVILLTAEALQDASWPRESIDELYGMPDLSNLEHVVNGVSYLARTQAIDHIIALDEYDGPMAAALREHLQIPGMGTSTARRFRDKLAMRVAAAQADILVPEFVAAINNDRIADYMRRVPPPWVLKPRAEATAIGIVKIEEEGALWQHLEHLGDRRSHYLLERFVPGNVYHVDSIVCGGQVVFAEAHAYGRPPMEVFHGGGISLSRTVARGSEDEQVLHAVNRHVLAALGMHQGASHLECIKGSGDGRFYFLEVGARVGGANTAEMVEAATGINLWAEWARVVVLGDRYSLPPRRANYGGVIVSLARQEHPDTSSFTEPEIVYRLDKHHHVGFVLVSESHERIRQLQDEYSRRIAHDYLATMPALETRPPLE